MRGRIYRHYKNKKLYVVTELATDTETGATLVIYYALGDNTNRTIWARPLTMFTEQLIHNNELVDRFTEERVF